MHGGMNDVLQGWIDEQIEGWMIGWMDSLMHKWIVTYIQIEMRRSMDLMDGRENEFIRIER